MVIEFRICEGNVGEIDKTIMELDIMSKEHERNEHKVRLKSSNGLK